MLASKLNWFQMERYLKEDDRAIVPLGSTEQHAYLSLATDSILAGKLAEEVGERLGVAVFPTVCYGLTPYFTAYPGTVSLRLETYAALVRDVLDSLYRQGIRRILLLNGHGGNTAIQPLLGEWRNQHPQARLLLHNWWASPKVQQMVQRHDPGSSHASWMENFPLTRLDGVEMPRQRKIPLSSTRITQLNASQLRDYLGDGNFGGGYQSDDQLMDDIWRQAIEETLEVLADGWGESANTDTK